jgi:hypothetical protein
MSAKYGQHPMERKFHEDREKQRKEMARITECYEAWKEQVGEYLGQEAAFRAGYVQGKYDAMRAAGEQGGTHG